MLDKINIRHENIHPSFSSVSACIRSVPVSSQCIKASRQTTFCVSLLQSPWYLTTHNIESNRNYQIYRYNYWFTYNTLQCIHVERQLVDCKAPSTYQFEPWLSPKPLHHQNNQNFSRFTPHINKGQLEFCQHRLSQS